MIRLVLNSVIRFDNRLAENTVSPFQKPICWYGLEETKTTCFATTVRMHPITVVLDNVNLIKPYRRLCVYVFYTDLGTNSNFSL